MLTGFNNIRRGFEWMDLLVAVFVFALLYAIVHLGEGMNVSFEPSQPPAIDLDPGALPYYAGRSLLRMFIAFAASLLFTFSYGYVAAKSRTAGKFMIPLLDVLQSIPVLGFLSVLITGCMAVFPGSLLGLELASILAIFTGQAWNMTFSFYHSLITVPHDLQEASAVLRLNWWQRLVRLEMPYSMIGLTWNSMMAFGGGWFFLAASEAISVLGDNFRLPGVGSYMATAIADGNMAAIVYSIVTMVLLVVLVDQFFWRPLVVWTQKFKMEMVDSTEQPTSWAHDILQQSKLVAFLNDILVERLAGGFYRSVNRLVEAMAVTSRRGKKVAGILLTAARWGLVVGMVYHAGQYAYAGWQQLSTVDAGQVLAVFRLGALTFGRVTIAIFLAVLWTLPVGVWIGLNPRLARFLQPVVQIAASFPANMLFPFVTVFYLRHSVNFEWGAIPLMMLGTQWYILFNVIAGAIAIPNDLREASRIFNLSLIKRWQKMVLPGIFPYLITGIITASGGAWNASIVSELVSWEGKDLVARGLGSYINAVTTAGDWPSIILGIAVMCVFVVAVNRLVWRPLYALAEEKYRLG
ncbi:MAG: ABC transporter permease subunit [Negativicutes bacterium]|nr:ABC transporter permease subunit [Negativicutes bacterium]